MKLPVYQQQPPPPTSGLLAVVVQLISSVESAIFKLAQWIQRPRNLDPNFTGHRFSWRKGDVKERRMPESRVELHLYGQQSWTYCRFATFQQRPPNRKYWTTWWWPRDRKLEILFIENLSALLALLGFHSSKSAAKSDLVFYHSPNGNIYSPWLPTSKALSIYGDCS